jgi:YidC/Oxa1 family membrane protein insertase
VFEKLTTNQRLIVAVVLSFLFFAGYSAIFPPKKSALHENNSSKVAASVEQNVSKSKEQTSAQTVQKILPSKKLSPSANSTLVTVHAKDYTLKIDTLGRISSMVLLNKKYNSKDDKPAQLIEQDGAKPLLLQFENSALNEAALKTAYEATAHTLTVGDKSQSVILEQKLPQMTVVKKLTFYADGHYDLQITLSKAAKYQIELGQRPKVSGEMMTVKGAMVYHGDGQTKIYEDDDVKEKHFFSDVHFVSSFDQYFADVIYGKGKKLTVAVKHDEKNDPLLYIDGSQNMQLLGYIGPKTYKTLKAIDPILTNTIEYGWFTFASRPLFAVLAWLHSIFGNWGWAIVALTLLVRLVLYPLTYKGMVSMQKMKMVAPKVKELQKKYKGDPQRTNAAVMSEYKKHGVNPLGGCLPMVLQIPVFFAMYRVFLNAPELQGAPWIFWIHDLARMDHLFILPILMGATMFIQQYITPNNFTDPLQEKVFKFLPVIFTFFFITFPSGLVLYWLVNNLASIAQQYFVNKKFATIKEPKEAPKDAEAAQ